MATDNPIAEQLSFWYEGIKRPLPWRTDASPYRTFVSEFMLQQTQVDTVIPYFNRFMVAFPTVFDLASASLDAVMKAWEGLGYYSRAKHLHRAAGVIANTLHGHVPQSYEDLQHLPGVGPYIAAAIASIAFEVPVPVVDGNVMRVFCRFWGIETDIRSPALRQDLFARLMAVVAGGTPSIINQAMMELGALVCRPKNPTCDRCPLGSDCVAKRDQRTAELPVKSSRPAIPHVNVGVGVIRHNGQILITKRSLEQMLGGLWEFPGGKQEEGEEIETTVRREIEEEVGFQVFNLKPLAVVKHAFTHFKITISAFWCEPSSDHSLPQDTAVLRWVFPHELRRFAFPTANRKIIDAIEAVIPPFSILASKRKIPTRCPKPFSTSI